MDALTSGDPSLGPGIYGGGHQWQRVQHGQGCVAALTAELQRLNIKRPFLVTTGSLVKEGRLLAAVREAAGVSIVGEFCETRAHAPRETVLKATHVARQSEPDGLIAFGGSTVVDTAKGMALAIAAKIETVKGFDEHACAAGCERAFADTLIPQVALPTTLSGAEYSRDIGITNAQLRRKELYRYDSVTPRSILLDPELTRATPKRLWGSTGIKVMSDAIEQVYSRRSHPIVDALCLQSIRWFARYLPLSDHADRAVSADARMRCQVASWMTLFGMHNADTRVGLGGALRHQLGGMFRIPHGEATCVMLPHVLLYNRQAVPDGYQRLADTLGVAADDQSADERAAKVVARIRELIRVLELPERLGPLCAKEADFPQMAIHVLREAAIEFNPRPVRNADDVVRLLLAAL